MCNTLRSSEGMLLFFQVSFALKPSVSRFLFWFEDKERLKTLHFCNYCPSGSASQLFCGTEHDFRDGLPIFDDVFVQSTSNALIIQQVSLDRSVCQMKLMYCNVALLFSPHGFVPGPYVYLTSIWPLFDPACTTQQVSAFIWWSEIWQQFVHSTVFSWSALLFFIWSPAVFVYPLYIAIYNLNFPYTQS